MTRKTRLIPFNFSRYQNGMTAILKDYRDNLVTGIFYNEEQDNYLVVSNTPKMELRCFYLDRDSLALEEEEEKIFYVNIYEDGVAGITYPDFSEAKFQRSHYRNYKGTLKVAYTEEDLIK